MKSKAFYISIVAVLVCGVVVYMLTANQRKASQDTVGTTTVQNEDISETEDGSNKTSTSGTQSVFGFASMPDYMPTSSNAVWGYQPWLVPERIEVTKPVSLQNIETKTHVSKFGYEITYPSTWLSSIDDTDAQLSETKGSKVETFSIFPPNGSDFVGSPVLVEVLHMSFDEYSKELIGSPMVPVLINGMEAQRFEPTENEAGFLFLQKKDEGYLVRVFLTYYGNVPPEELVWVLSTIKVK